MKDDKRFVCGGMSEDQHQARPRLISSIRNTVVKEAKSKSARGSGILTDSFACCCGGFLLLHPDFTFYPTPSYDRCLSIRSKPAVAYQPCQSTQDPSSEQQRTNVRKPAHQAFRTLSHPTLPPADCDVLHATVRRLSTKAYGVRTCSARATEPT